MKSFERNTGNTCILSVFAFKYKKKRTCACNKISKNPTGYGKVFIMLSLKNITKNYEAGDTTVEALRGISLNFRKSEFVSILGPSGCGKTTMLNIIGGLDRYTSGDLTIAGISTKKYKSRDWDTYRNHSIGFVFQNYNLIPHQSVLSNVELALTLSGVSKSERRARAKEALIKVGLGDQLHKRPNQMSGGQMQRVAIARALVNDPEILLADEPTGALDTATSVQIMELLKEISRDRLIIMVTHNPDLAETYSTRIIKLLDGRVTDDSNPFSDGEYRIQSEAAQKASSDAAVKKTNKGRKKRTSMSFLTALSLSTNNLMTKKARTFLTAFAGSIGIIGIALILSLSHGLQAYIDRMQEDTLSSYPIVLESESIDYSGMMASMMGANVDEDTLASRDENTIYSNDIMTDMMSTVLAELEQNDLAAFKEYLDDENSEINNYLSSVQYGYRVDINLYSPDTEDAIVKVNPSNLMNDMMGVTYGNNIGTTMSTTYGSGLQIFEELIGDQTLLDSQYDVIAGRWPERYDELVLVVDKNNEISDYVLYSLNLKSQEELSDIMNSLIQGETFETTQVSFSFDEMLNTSFKLVLPCDSYAYDEASGTWTDLSQKSDSMREVVNNGIDVRIVGIIRPNEDAVASSITGSIGYTSDLTAYVINETNASDIVLQQKEHPDIDVFTGIPFPADDAEKPSFTMDDVNAYAATLSPEEQATMQQYFSVMSEEEILDMFASMMGAQYTEATYEGNLTLLGVTDLDSPSSISLYTDSFENKDHVIDIIESYNNDMTAAGEDDKVLTYTDYVGLLMSSVSTIIHAISYILIAFVAISLVVSSIMIGIITYISVLERTKEIGILRSIGASKRDISRVFNAETLIVGFSAGFIGILVTVLLDIPINLVIHHLTGIRSVAILPVGGAVILVVISMLLTVIAGLFPAKIASKKDPVIALRSDT